MYYGWILNNLEDRIPIWNKSFRIHITVQCSVDGAGLVVLTIFRCALRAIECSPLIISEYYKISKHLRLTVNGRKYLASRVPA
jgi:hypothetical protein